MLKNGRKIHVVLMVLALALLPQKGLFAAEGDPEAKAAPVITGYTFSRFVLSDEEIQVPLAISPILLFPIGKHLLLEAELELEGESEKMDGEDHWEQEFEREIEYLQLDVLAHKYITLVGGRFLIPFGTYIERLHPSWIKNLQQNPITFGFLEHSGNGVMARGGATPFRGVNLNYSAYFTMEADAEWVASERMFGGRLSAFVPSWGTEAGFSYNGTRDIEMADTVSGIGLDLSQQFKRLDIRGEYARFSGRGSGYWAEATHRFNYVRFWKPFFERTQIVARWEQFFAPPHEEEEEEGMEEGHTALPEMDTKRLSAGLNFYITNDLKISTGYTRSIAAGENDNIFDMGVSWRF